MDQVYRPTVIADIPFPNGDDSRIGSFSRDVIAAPKGQVNPALLLPTAFPRRIIAQETLSQTLNTKQKKILDQYEFTKLGALQIGDYDNGNRGDIRLSPDGIVGRNKDGNTTFSVDGDTGDAAFLGEVRAKDFIISDELGLLSLSNFNNASNFVAFGSNEHFTSTTPTDVTGSEFTISLQRDTNVFFNVSAIVYAFWTGGESAALRGTVQIVIDGEVVSRAGADGGMVGGVPYGGIPDNLVTTIPLVAMRALRAGTHVIKLQAFRSIVIGVDAIDFVVNGFRFVYIVLGS